MNVLILSRTLPINEFSIVPTDVQIYLTVNLKNLYSYIDGSLLLITDNGAELCNYRG